MSSLAYPLGVPPTTPSLDDPNDPAKRAAAAAMPLGMTTAAPLAAPAPATPAAPLPNPPAAPVMPALNRPALALNPQLPQHPASAPPANLDAQYNAEQAQLAQEISQRYNDVLKQLGYLDPSTGQFVMGRVETDANRQRQELNRSLGLASEEQTNQRQLEGTLFSGRRGTEEARAQHPFVQSLADLDVNVPTQLSDLYETGGNLLTEYTNRQNLMLVEAARRRAAGLLTSAYPDPSAPAPDPNAPPDSTVPDPTLLDPTAPGIDPYADPTLRYNRGLPQGI